MIRAAAFVRTGVGLYVVSFWAPRWPQEGPKRPPRGRQEAPKRPPKGPKKPPRGLQPKAAQDCNSIATTCVRSLFPLPLALLTALFSKTSSPLLSLEALPSHVNRCLQMFVAGFIRLPNVWGWPVMRRRRCQSGHPQVGRVKTW